MSVLYSQYSAEDASDFLDNLKKKGLNPSFQADKAKIMDARLPFAPAWRKVVCEDYSITPPLKAVYFTDGKTIIPAEYGPDPYNAIISHFSPQIDADTAYAYVQFFFSLYMKGGEYVTPFTHLDDVGWQDELPPMTRQSLEKELSAYPVVEKQQDGTIQVIFACIFHTALLTVTARITPDGRLSITDRAVIAEDLPVKKFP